MAQLPRAPKKSDLEDAPLSVQNYIKRLLKLAKDGLEIKNTVSPEFQVGKIVKDDDGELDILVIITLKRGGKPARNYPINELSINLEGLLDNPVFTDNLGQYSYRYHTKIVDSLEVNLGLLNFNNFNEPKLRYYQKIIEIVIPTKKQSNKLEIVIPEIRDNNVVTKTQDTFGFVLNLKPLKDTTPIKDTVYIISNNNFRYWINGVISKASRNHSIEVDGHLIIQLLPSKNWQKITFFTEGSKPKTFIFKSKT